MLEIHTTLQTFFKRYQEFEATWWGRRLEEEKVAFDNFKTRYLPLQENLQMLRRQESPHFNIFYVLNVRHYEEVVHTPMLAHLLNPIGEHAQGSLFLDNFFDQVLNIPLKYSQVTNFNIYEEFATTYGRIDIILRFSKNKQQHAIVIENKIYAGDQKGQLQRYYNYLSEFLRLSPENIKIVYLKPYAGPPSVDSMEKIQYEQLKEQNLILERGYREHVIPWLSNIHHQIQSPAIQSLVFQYLNLIKTL